MPVVSVSKLKKNLPPNAVAIERPPSQPRPATPTTTPPPPVVPQKDPEKEALGKKVDGDTPVVPLAMLRERAEGSTDIPDTVFFDFLNTTMQMEEFSGRWSQHVEALLKTGLTSGLLASKIAGNGWGLVSKQFWPAEAVMRHYPNGRLRPFPKGDGIKEVESQRFSRVEQANGTATAAAVNNNGTGAGIEPGAGSGPGSGSGRSKNATSTMLARTTGNGPTTPPPPPPPPALPAPAASNSNMLDASPPPPHMFSMRCEQRSTNKTGMIQLIATLTSFGKAFKWSDKCGDLLRSLSQLPGSGGGCLYKKGKFGAGAGGGGEGEDDGGKYDALVEVFFERGPNPKATANRVIEAYEELTESLPLAKQSKFGVYQEEAAVFSENPTISKAESKENGKDGDPKPPKPEKIPFDDNDRRMPVAAMPEGQPGDNPKVGW